MQYLYKFSVAKITLSELKAIENWPYKKWRSVKFFDKLSKQKALLTFRIGDLKHESLGEAIFSVEDTKIRVRLA